MPHAEPIVIDIHTHAFPRLGAASGCETAEYHTNCIQTHVQFHAQGIRRADDDSRVNGHLLAPEKDGVDYLRDVNFHVSGNGRLEFTVDGENYYIQWYPPWMSDMTARPEMMVAFMNYVGVDMGVFQHDHVYGALDEYLADVVREYPDRFIALAQVREWEADQDAQLERLRRQVEELGHRGLYYSVEAFAQVNYETNLLDPRWEPLWDLVRELSIPVFWILYQARINRFERYVEQVELLDRWAADHEDIPSVWTHGFESPVMRPRSERFDIPDSFLQCLKRPNMNMEVMLHLMAPDTQYPWPWAQEMLKQCYDAVGPEKLMWGSDMPAAERNYPYHQIMDYIRIHCDFLSDEDRDLILGGNAARMFGVDRPGRFREVREARTAPGMERVDV